MKRLAQIAIAIGFGVLLLEIYTLLNLQETYEFKSHDYFVILLPLGTLYLWLFERKSKNKN